MRRSDASASRGVPVAVVLVCLAAGSLWSPGTRAEDGGDEFVQQGTASWYGPGFHGQKTASGERYDQEEMTAAHPSLPFDTEAKVTNLENGRSVEVQINDRGPYAEGRVIDLSKAAAEKLDMTEDGTVPVRIEAEEGSGEGR